MKTIDIIVCAYNEEPMIPILLTEVTKVLQGLPQYAFRLIVVDDGSGDKTLEKLVEAQAHYPHLAVISLARNFGHEGALAAGLAAVSGDAAIVMDADLQDPPELIGELIQKWEAGFDVVNARRASRNEDSWMKRWTAKKFYSTINQLSGKVRIPENVGNYRLLSRRVVDLLNALPERNRVFRILIPYLGFPTDEVRYARPKRAAGKTHYNWTSMTRLAVDGITSATIIPLKFAINVGLAVASLGFAGLAYVVAGSLMGLSGVPGWASTISTILFLGGIQLLILGIIGEYIGRIFLEVKARPPFIVQTTLPNSATTAGQKKETL